MNYQCDLKLKSYYQFIQEPELPTARFQNNKCQDKQNFCNLYSWDTSQKENFSFCIERGTLTNKNNFLLNLINSEIEEESLGTESEGANDKSFENSILKDENFYKSLITLFVIDFYNKNKDMLYKDIHTKQIIDFIENNELTNESFELFAETFYATDAINNISEEKFNVVNETINLSSQVFTKNINLVYDSNCSNADFKFSLFQLKRSEDISEKYLFPCMHIPFLTYNETHIATNYSANIYCDIENPAFNVDHLLPQFIHFWMHAFGMDHEYFHDNNHALHEINSMMNHDNPNFQHNCTSTNLNGCLTEVDHEILDKLLG